MFTHNSAMTWSLSGNEKETETREWKVVDLALRYFELFLDTHLALGWIQSALFCYSKRIPNTLATPVYTHPCTVADPKKHLVQSAHRSIICTASSILTAKACCGKSSPRFLATPCHNHHYTFWTASLFSLTQTLHATLKPVPEGNTVEVCFIKLQHSVFRASRDTSKSLHAPFLRRSLPTHPSCYLPTRTPGTLARCPSPLATLLPDSTPFFLSYFCFRSLKKCGCPNWQPEIQETDAAIFSHFADSVARKACKGGKKARQKWALVSLIAFFPHIFWCHLRTDAHFEQTIKKNALTVGEVRRATAPVKGASSG